MLEYAVVVMLGRRWMEGGRGSVCYVFYWKCTSRSRVSWLCLRYGEIHWRTVDGYGCAFEPVTFPWTDRRLTIEPPRRDNIDIVNCGCIAGCAAALELWGGNGGIPPPPLPIVVPGTTTALLVLSLPLNGDEHWKISFFNVYPPPLLFANSSTADMSSYMYSIYLQTAEASEKYLNLSSFNWIFWESRLYICWND